VLKRTEVIRKIVLIFTILLVSVAATAIADDEKAKIDWNDEQLNWHSYEEGIKLIKETGKPGLLVIYADWCPACQNHSKDFFSNNVIDRLEDLILIRSNRDDEEAISNLYDLDGTYIPRIIALDGKSEVIQELYDTSEKYAYFNPTRSKSRLIDLIIETKKYSGN